MPSGSDGSLDLYNKDERCYYVYVSYKLSTLFNWAKESKTWGKELRPGTFGPLDDTFWHSWLRLKYTMSNSGSQ